MYDGGMDIPTSPSRTVHKFGLTADANLDVRAVDPKIVHVGVDPTGTEQWDDYEPGECCGGRPLIPRCADCGGSGDLGLNLGCRHDATGDPFPYCKTCDGTGVAP